MLKDIPLFSSLDENALKTLSQFAIKKIFSKNTVLLSEGDESHSLYIIKKGQVKVTINDTDGKEVILSILSAGDYFGEMALIDGEPRSACVITREQTELLVISKNDFMKIFLSNPDMAYNLLKGFLKRLREANKKIEALALMDVYGRIARLLSNLAKEKNDHKLIVEEKLTHQEIANMVGASREMVSRILKELSVGGYISINKKIITIHKKLPYSW